MAWACEDRPDGSMRSRVARRHYARGQLWPQRPTHHSSRGGDEAEPQGGARRESARHGTGGAPVEIKEGGMIQAGFPAGTTIVPWPDAATIGCSNSFYVGGCGCRLWFSGLCPSPWRGSRQAVNGLARAPWAAHSGDHTCPPEPKPRPPTGPTLATRFLPPPPPPRPLDLAPRKAGVALVVRPGIGRRDGRDLVVAI